MDFNSLILPAGLAAGAAILFQAKNICVTLFNKINTLCSYSIYFDENDVFYDTFSTWFKNNYEHKFKRTQVKLIHKYELNQYICKLYQFTDYNMLWYENRLLIITKSREKLEAAQNIYNVYFNTYTVRGLFAKKAITKLINEITNEKNKSLKPIDLQIQYNGKGNNYFTRNYPVIKGFTSLFFNGKQELINDLNQYKNNKFKYDKLGINYKRGYFLYGPPGTGKTSTAMAIAKHLGRSLYCINLASIESDTHLQELITNITDNACILFEDIDGIIENRTTKENIKFNFSTLLNILDGTYAPYNAVFIITTNKPEVIDSAILRKGRMDFCIEINYPTNQNIEDFLNHFYGTNIKLCDPHLQSKINMTDLQNLCLNNDINTVLNTITASTINEKQK